MNLFCKACTAVTLSVLVAASASGAKVYIVNDVGFIKEFSGVSAGATPMEGQSFAAGGILMNTAPAYGTYQGFTHAPDGKVYGINGGGDVVSWDSVGDWIAATTPTTLSVDAFADKTNGNGGKNGAGDGTVHGLSYNGRTGGFYVTWEDNSSALDGDVFEYATLSDLLNNTPTSMSGAGYGGNILNFWYPHEDASGNRPPPNDVPGANYFQVSGGGTLEGFQTLADYIAAPANATYSQGGFGAGLRGGFALVPEPSTGLIGLGLLGGLVGRRRR